MTNKKPASIGEQIVKSRKEQGISGYRLAKKTGLSQSHVHNIESGAGMSADTLQRIVDVLQVPITVYPSPRLLTR